MILFAILYDNGDEQDVDFIVAPNAEHAQQTFEDMMDENDFVFESITAVYPLERICGYTVTLTKE